RLCVAAIYLSCSAAEASPAGTERGPNKPSKTAPALLPGRILVFTMLSSVADSALGAAGAPGRRAAPLDAFEIFCNFSDCLRPPGPRKDGVPQGFRWGIGTD